MPTRPQIIAIQKARRALKLTDDAYRTVLRSIGKVESSKDLDNSAVEQVMAVFEAQGYQSHPAGKTYWRDKADLRGGRQVWKVYALAGDPANRYDLPALCARFSGGRTDCPEQLDGQQLYALIEMLKGANAREASPRRSRGRQHVMEDSRAQQILPF